MPTPTKGARLGGSPAHEKLILSNLATSLFEHGAITTTAAKAKRLQPLAEQMITKAKRGDLNSRRQVMKRIKDKSVVHVLFTEIGERYADRSGGYTRITKLGPRKGDNAPMVKIELVEALADSPKAKKTAKKAPAKKAAAPQAEETEFRFDPAKPLQTLPERAQIFLEFGIVLSVRHKDPDAPYFFGRLRASKWPHERRTKDE